MKISQVLLTGIAFLFWILPTDTLAQPTNQFINIVNPIRVSFYTKDPGASLVSQYAEVRKRQLAATWLLTYDALLNKGINSVSLTMDKSQEFGLFLEITPLFARDSGVNYNKTDSWHRANAVFLSGYTQSDRIRLIDTIFGKFKDIYGYYPASVGAWWIDSYSLKYMQRKYKISANLICADQFSTDGYEIWGQYWSTPFYPSKMHAGVPAQTLDSKLDVVTIQWAARDPLNGYGRGPASRFSTQDYQEIDYFQKLANLYANAGSNRFGQITVGLEGDFSPQTYASPSFFASQLDVIKAEIQRGSVNVVTMKDFSKWYREIFPKLSPAQIIQSDDLLGKKIRSIWYQSPNFRINITYDYNTKETKIRDFRTYHDNFQEPYYVSPNRDLNLSINIPSQIDSASNPDEEWLVFSDLLEDVKSGDEVVTLNYNKHKIQLTKGQIEIIGDIKNIPNSLNKSPLINVGQTTNKINLRPKASFNFSEQGLIFRSLTQEATYFLRQRKVILFEILIVILFGGMLFFINKRKITIFYKGIIITSVGLLIIGTSYKWYLSNSQLYFVNQSELDALNRLKLMPGKKIVISDKTCLQCSWHTVNIPAIFANKRDYVKEVTGKDIVYNAAIFNAKTRPEAKKELDKLNADYIYLVRFENYIELAPFSPGDLNIEEIYANANAQIWKVKKS